jgi:Flp pilus assembly protein protease CpaA
MIEIITALTVSLIATYIDLKERYVPDFINYFLIIFGLVSNAIISLIQNSYKPILFSIAGAGIFFAFGAILYYTGVWGGGDAKLLAGFGAVFATFPNIVAWPFLLSLLFNMLFLGTIFGILGSIYLAFKHKEAFVKEIKKLREKYDKFYKILWSSVFVFLILVYYFNWSPLARVTTGLGILLLFYLMIMLKAVENCCMYRKINPTKLVEGDWLIQEVKVQDNVVYKPEKSGISTENIKKLIALQKLGKLKQVIVKDGLPYVPAFLASLIISVAGIDLMFMIFSKLL